MRWVCIPENLHQILKKAAASELRREGYELFFEPAYSPFKRLHWFAYRPDIMGLISGDHELRLAFVECETSPRPRKMNDKTCKISSSLNLQKCLDEGHSFRFLLVIPTGTLSRILCPAVRRLWEVWTVNNLAEVVTKLSKTERGFPSKKDFPRTHA